MNNLSNREPKYKIITCNKEDLLDSMWLFNNIPWSNHDDVVAKITFDEPITIFISDRESAEIKSGEFNNVIIGAFHGYGGNNYTFQFKFDNNVVFSILNERHFAYSKEDLKERLIEETNLRLKGLEYQLNIQKENIEYNKSL